jgi:folate-binding protein YgfZ
MKFPTHAAVFWWKPAAWLRVTGADAANFLQGQFTNDLRALAPGGAVYGLWLNVKGKILADSFVLRGAAGDEFWIGSYFSPAVVIRERLESFVIADDVVINDLTADWLGVAVVGSGARQAMGGEPVDGFVFPGRRSYEENVEWIFPATSHEAARLRLAGARELSADEVSRMRIEAAIPAVPADLGLGDLPGEGQLEAAAISYTKGCYLGQEVMARLKSMGQVRRRLARVTFTADTVPTLPAALFLGTRTVGELRSATPDGKGAYVGLAMVSLLHVAEGARIAFSAEAPPSVTVVDSL